MKTLFILLLLCCAPAAFGQVAINNDASQPDASAMLDIKSTSKGLLAPRMTKANRDAIASPATGLIVYQTDNTPGYYYNAGTPASPGWVPVWELSLPYSRTINVDDIGFTIYNSNTVSGRAIMGVANGASGTTVGIWGSAASPTGVGVQGRNSAISGAANGIRGESFSPAGVGVYGHNYATAGTAAGVVGWTASSAGTGVYGINPSITGAGYGVSGATSSPDGIGVFGNGGKWGVWGRTDVPAGCGVVGSALSSSTTGTGVYGYSTSTTGIGVLGRNLQTTGANNGVRGEAYSDNGEGVVGLATSATGVTKAIHGIVSSPDGFAGYFEGSKVYLNGNLGIGVLSPTAKLDVAGNMKITDGTQGAGKVLTSDAAGLASWQALPALPTPGGASSQVQFNNAGTFAGDANLVWDAANHRLGIGIGPMYPFHASSSMVRTVYVENTLGGGAAVFAFANHPSASSVGVRGQTSSTGGSGLYGDVTATTGVNYGVRGVVASPDGYSGFFTGGRFYVSGNVGIGNASPAAKLDIAGTIKIADGTQGAGKVLTSDAAGLASWNALPALPIPGGASSQVQFNNAGVFAGDANLLWDAANHRLGIGTIPFYALHMFGSPTSATAFIENTNGAGGQALVAYASATGGTNTALFAYSKSTGGTAVKANVLANTGTNYGVSSSVSSADGYSGYFTGGKFYVSSNVGLGVTAPASRLDVDGGINLTGEVTRTATGAAQLLPIAYGNVSASGFINSGSGNFTVTYNTASKWYEIAISGENYFYTNYTTVVTPLGMSIAVTSSVSGRLLVEFYTIGGLLKQDGFSFVVYKP